MRYVLQKIVSAFFLFLVLSSALFAQPDEQRSVESEFSRALTFYKNGNFEAALPIFQWIVDENRLNSKTTPASIFIAKSLLNLDRIIKAESSLRIFISSYPNSKYLDEAKMTLADAYYRENQIEPALKTLLEIISQSKNTDYVNSAKSSVRSIALSGYDLAILENIAIRTSDPKTHPFLYLSIGEAYLRFDKPDEARRMFNYVISESPTSPEYDTATKLYQQSMLSSEADTKDITIAVLLPTGITSGDIVEDERGYQILQGIKYAVHLFNNKSHTKIGLIIRDTGVDEIRAAALCDELIRIPSLRLVIGPMSSEATEKICNLLSPHNIPVISPTATANNLTLLCRNFFQANPSHETRGRAMAQYAYLVEGKRHIAIFYYEYGYSSVLKEAFADEFVKLGGVIEAISVYPVEDTDLSAELVPIVAVKSKIDAIYAPIANKKVINTVLSAFSTAGINTTLYGNQDWYVPKGIETTAGVSNQITFDSDYFIPIKNTGYISESDAFKKLAQFELNRTALYGFDVAQFVISLIEQGNISRNQLKEALLSAPVFQAYHNDIALTGDRTNVSLNILRYDGSNYTFVQRFHYSPR